MKIYLIRHARQNSALCNVNVALSEIGIEQAKLVTTRLEKYNIDAIYSSNLIRAIETAEIINRELNLQHQISSGIREISFGDLEGKSNEQIEEMYKDFQKERRSMKEDIPYPNGECGEDVFKRAMPVIKEIIKSGKKNVVVVTHGGTIRALLAGIFLKDQKRKFQVGLTLENCSITELNYKEDEETFYLERFNDYAHLETNEKLLRKNW